MENKRLEILKRLESKVDGIESKVDNLREDLNIVEKVVANNCYDIVKLRVKNNNIDNTEVLNRIEYKINRTEDLIINLKNKIYKNIE